MKVLLNFYEDREEKGEKNIEEKKRMCLCPRV
jgi:hypothetical protein